MAPKPPSETTINERRDFFRVEDKVLLRCLAVDQNSALANDIPPQFSSDPAYRLMRDLQHIDQENSKYLRTIAENNRELDSYLKSITKKIELIASCIVQNLDPAADQQPQPISISEGGLSFSSSDEYAPDSYLAMQLTLLPSHISLVIFAKVISCSKASSEQQKLYSSAVSFVHLKDNDRQIIAKHIMHLQLIERRQQADEKT